MNSEKLLTKTVLHSVRTLQKTQAKLRQAPAQALPGQPFDRLLLAKSPLFSQSRRLFLKSGGSLTPALLSSPRSLSSGSLTTLDIEYTPSEPELIWTATDAVESRTRPERLLELRTWTTSLFHEQNHRTLWKFLPPAPTERAALVRYLHFAESLVVMLDMALSDFLGPKLAGPLYQVGAVYDPGTSIVTGARRGTSTLSADYRHALRAAGYATYLNLELFHPNEIPAIIDLLFPKELYRERSRQNWSLRFAERALRLDRQFVENTNPVWQQKHLAQLPAKFRVLQSAKRRPLILPEHPLDAQVQLEWIDRTLDLFEI